MLQVVFRKIADVLREKELAERDPPLELSTDHPVRRLISRFRKMSCSRLPAVSPTQAGLPLTDLSPTDTLTVERAVALAGRKTHSIDAGGTTETDTTNNNCRPTSNGGGAVAGGGQATRVRVMSADATASTTTAAAAAADGLPSNNASTRAATRTDARNSEERVLLSDNMVPNYVRPVIRRFSDECSQTVSRRKGPRKQNRLQFSSGTVHDECH